MIPPVSPRTPQNPLYNLPGTIRQYLNVRGIWKRSAGRYALNDEFSRQIRRDTRRFRTAEKHRVGI